jgi:hypothetical protein
MDNADEILKITIMRVLCVYYSKQMQLAHFAESLGSVLIQTLRRELSGLNGLNAGWKPVLHRDENHDSGFRLAVENTLSARKSRGPSEQVALLFLMTFDGPLTTDHGQFSCATLTPCKP